MLKIKITKKRISFSIFVFLKKLFNKIKKYFKKRIIILLKISKQLRKRILNWLLLKKKNLKLNLLLYFYKLKHLMDVD